MVRHPGKEQIEAAALRIKPWVHNTPLLTSSNLNNLFGGSLFFKCENFQKAGAFKFRGAINALMQLSPEDFKRGVATHSSGNHAAALSLAARLLGTTSHIVMPENSNAVKIAATRSYGGNITFCAPTLQARESTLVEVIERTGACEIHPYNNLHIIEGQATTAYEVFQERTDMDQIIAPVGGGGLLSGTALSARFFSPITNVIAAEPLGADDAFRSFKSKEFVPSENPQTIADGLRTSLGSLTFPIVMDYVDEVVTVSEQNIIAAMRLIWERMKIIVEPSSAVPLAAIMESKIIVAGKKTVIILSGGNVDLNHLPF